MSLSLLLLFILAWSDFLIFIISVTIFYIFNLNVTNKLKESLSLNQSPLVASVLFLGCLKFSKSSLSAYKLYARIENIGTDYKDFELQ